MIELSDALSFLFFSMFMSSFLEKADTDPILEFAQVPFNHPLFIMYSSGTTGAPKCMVHSVGVMCLNAFVLFLRFVVYSNLYDLFNNCLDNNISSIIVCWFYGKICHFT